MPPPGPPPSPTPSSASWLAVLLALALGALAIAVLCLLTGGVLAFALAAALVIFGMAALHYLLWGWWLSTHIRRDVEDSHRAAAERGDDVG